jgi:hypothetical protein
MIVAGGAVGGLEGLCLRLIAVWEGWGGCWRRRFYLGAAGGVRWRGRLCLGAMVWGERSVRWVLALRLSLPVGGWLGRYERRAMRRLLGSLLR